jgi:hypothetical protein
MKLYMAARVAVNIENQTEFVKADVIYCSLFEGRVTHRFDGSGIIHL